jgi:hypothetical protein
VDVLEKGKNPSSLPGREQVSTHVILVFKSLKNASKLRFIIAMELE